jgi:hypothetical protein
MAKRDQSLEDLDAMIDRAVDTVFVEAVDEGDDIAMADTVDVLEAEPTTTEPPPSSPPAATKSSPSLDEAVESLFMTSFEEEPATEAPQPVSAPSHAPAQDPAPSFEQTPTMVTSGDADMDRAIDVAVDTLFVEEVEAPAPDTTELKVEEVVSELDTESIQTQPAHLDRPPSQDIRTVQEPQPLPPPAPSEAETQPAGESGEAYNDLMAREIERHMHTLFSEPAVRQAPAEAGREEAPARESARQAPAAHVTEETRELETIHLKRLQEAILTLEWEITRPSVEALRREIKAMRSRFHDNVTVDFAALSMRVVLDYVVKRLSKAHPESIRFLLHVTDFLDKSLASSRQDPLNAFHQILMRYETYKSTVRSAEGLPDEAPKILDQLSIRDPEQFSQLVETQAMTLIKAAYSLAKRMQADQDPKQLIRSFRFLVNRSVNQILEHTHDKPPQTKGKKKKRRSATKAL